MHNCLAKSAAIAATLVDCINDDPAGLDGGPLPALVVHGCSKHKGQDEQPLDSHQLAVIMLRLSSPCQESGHILQARKSNYNVGTMQRPWLCVVYAMIADGMKWTHIHGAVEKNARRADIAITQVV